MKFQKNGKQIKSMKFGDSEIWVANTDGSDRCELQLDNGQLLEVRIHPMTDVITPAPPARVPPRKRPVRVRQEAALPVWFAAVIGMLLLSIMAFIASGLLGGKDTVPPVEPNAVVKSDITITPDQPDINQVNAQYTPLIDAHVSEPEEIVEEEAVPVFRFEDVPLEESVQAFIQTRSVTEERTRLVTAMIWRESSFRTDVISSTNDYGLMQINGMNHDWLKGELGIDDFLDPIDNITAGTYMIFDLLDKHDGNYHLALMEYNMGLGNARKLWADGIYSSKYSRAIVAKMDELALITE